jgi:hypothetical protein
MRAVPSSTTEEGVMQKKTTMFLCAGLISIVLSGCGNGDGTDFQGMVRDFSQAQEAVVTMFCACATDSGSAFCQEHPQMCFGDTDACREAMDWGMPTDAQIDCIVAAMQTDAAQSEKVAKCSLDVTNAYKSCLEQVSDCAAADVLQCGEDAEDAGNACPDMSASVEDAIEACFE